MVKSKVIRLGLEYIEKLELLAELFSHSKREVAERAIQKMFEDVVTVDPKRAKQILELKRKTRIRQQEMDMEIPLRLKDDTIVRVEDNAS